MINYIQSDVIHLGAENWFVEWLITSGRLRTRICFYLLLRSDVIDLRGWQQSCGVINYFREAENPHVFLFITFGVTSLTFEGWQLSCGAINYLREAQHPHAFWFIGSLRTRICFDLLGGPAPACVLIYWEAEHPQIHTTHMTGRLATIISLFHVLWHTDENIISSKPVKILVKNWQMITDLPWFVGFNSMQVRVFARWVIVFWKSNIVTMSLVHQG